MKERASVEPPLVFDSARPFQADSSEEGSKGSPSDGPAAETDSSKKKGQPHDSSGFLRKGAAQLNKRDRSAAGLGDTLRANNEATNKTLRESEEHKNARHQELTALKERELNLEAKKVILAEKNIEQAKETSAGLIGALGQLAQAVLQLASK